MKKIAPSILAADFGQLANEVSSVAQAGADWLHVDVMDGVFVPNLSIGLPVVEALSRITDLPLDVHLMIINPEKYFGAFVKAGAQYLTFHVEASRQVRQNLEHIKELGAKAGLSLRPGTPVETLEPFLDLVDLILIMTVEPGFGGQAFLQDQVSKIHWLFEKRATHQYSYLIQVDGGINDKTAPLCLLADSLVAGTYIFKSPDRKQAIDTLRRVSISPN